MHDCVNEYMPLYSWKVLTIRRTMPNICYCVAQGQFRRGIVRVSPYMGSGDTAVVGTSLVDGGEMSVAQNAFWSVLFLLLVVYMSCCPSPSLLFSPQIGVKILDQQPPPSTPPPPPLTLKPCCKRHPLEYHRRCVFTSGTPSLSSVNNIKASPWSANYSRHFWLIHKK